MESSTQTTPSQAAIGRALGISPASVTKCKGMGMPVHSVEAARAWREHNIAPTMHERLRGNATRQHRPKQPHPSGALPHARALLKIAAAALEAGQTIAAMVPTLRAAMHAVPEVERDDPMLLPMEVMDVLVADVVALLPSRDALNDDGSPAWHSEDNPMSDDEAHKMGSFWFHVAAGEIRPT